MLPIIAALFEKIPVLCWALMSICAMAYTTTLCTVMLRSSAVSVTIDGMSMEMTKAAVVQSTAADDLDAAAKTIADLKAQVAALQTPALLRTSPIPSPAPLVERAAEERVVLKQRSAQMRQQAAQMQQQVQQQQQR